MKPIRTGQPGRAETGSSSRAAELMFQKKPGSIQGLGDCRHLQAKRKRTGHSQEPQHFLTPLHLLIVQDLYESFLTPNDQLIFIHVV